MQSAVFVGLGYIGLPTAALVASSGIRVLGVDVNPGVVSTINEGRIHITEPDLDGLVHEMVKCGMLRAALKPESADAFFIVVPTPFTEDRRGDTRYVEAAVHSILPFLNPGNLMVIESTSPVRTTEKMAELVFASRPELRGKIHIAYCPERVLPGRILHELVHNDRVIGGINPESTEAATGFYRKFVRGTLHPSDARTAEMCKLTENASRDMQIAFANELSMICDEAGIDVWKLISLANRHPRVNILQPSCGVGGHCIAVDPWFIVSDYPAHAALIRRARETNVRKADWCYEKVITAAATFRDVHQRNPVVACMGLAFKPDIDDLRESPALEISQQLARHNDLETLFVEPNIASLHGRRLMAVDEAYEKADIIVWLVRHKEFVILPKATLKIELDFCGVRRNIA